MSEPVQSCGSSYLARIGNLIYILTTPTRWFPRFLLMGALIAALTTLMGVSLYEPSSCYLHLNPTFTDCTPDRIITRVLLYPPA